MSQKIYHGADLILESPTTALPQNVERSSAVTVTASASTNTKGSWAQLVASTTAQTDWLLVHSDFSATSAQDTTFLLDIGTGASGSEVVTIGDIGLGQRPFLDGIRQPPGPLLFPIRIASGVRIAARAQSNIASRAATVTIGLLSGAARSAMPTTLDTIGADTAASRGTNMPSNNTFVQVTASTSQAYQALVVSATGSGTDMANETSRYTIATGASGSEVDIFAFDVQTTTGETIRLNTLGEFTTTYIGHIPSGTRLAAKQSIGRNYRDVILYGVPYA